MASPEEYFYGEEYLPKMSKETKSLAMKIIAFHYVKQPFYASDVLNMMIESDLLSLSDARELLKEFNKAPVAATLPKSFIVED